MRAAFYWEAAGLSLDRANPYGALLARGMAGIGVELVAGFAHDLNQDWLQENLGRIDVLHLNWPHYMYAAPSVRESVARCTDLISHLALARSLGYRVVWTVHNLYPHDAPYPELDRLARLAITQMATAIIVHCRHAGELVRQHFYRRDGIFVIPHGHFIDPYPNTVTRSEARRRLGIDQGSLVYLAFGNIKRYKGFDDLIDAFHALPGDELALLLAVKARDEYGAAFVERARQLDPRIHLHTAEFFGNDEFQFYLNAADVAVLPFTGVLTSGTVITALSFGLPVIVPALGCLPELLNEEMGIVYDPQQSGALGRAMQAIRDHDLDTYGRAAYRRAESLCWKPIARQTLEAYRHE